MDTKTKIIPFVELTNFQQWVIFYIRSKGSMGMRVEYEINNFCDKTKNAIDIENYDDDMAQLQQQLEYFQNVGILDSVDIDHMDEDGLLIKQGYLTFTQKGRLYCFQELENQFEYTQVKEILDKILTSDFYNKSKNICEQIISHQNFKNISNYVIEDKKITMEKIIIIVEILTLINGVK